jgi:hypothetical protein
MKQPAFARVLGVNVPDGPVFGESFFSVELVGEVFAPPEVREGKAFWNFADRNGKTTCAIVAKDFGTNKEVEMKFIAPAGNGREFFDWATEKLNLTENGQLAPAFLGTQKTSLRIERL